MQTDKTYTPLQTDFDHVVSTYFPNCSLSADQRRSLEIMFFAGAASAYHVLTATPEKRDTLYDELLDRAEHAEASA